MPIENQSSKNILHDKTLSLLPQEQGILYFNILQNNLKKDVLQNPSAFATLKKTLSSSKQHIESGDPIQDAKDYFKGGLILCMMLNNFNGQYNTSNFLQDRELFRKTIEAYVVLKPTETTWIQEQLAPRKWTIPDLEIFFDKLATYYQWYLNTSIDWQPPLLETYSSALDAYKNDQELFDQKSFAKIMDEAVNYYLLKNMSKSWYADTFVAYEVNILDQSLVKSILDIFEQKKDTIFVKLEEFVQYKSDKETFLKKEKFWRRKKKEEEMKTFGRKEFSIYVQMATNYDLLRKIYVSMDITFADSPAYKQDSQKIQKLLEDIVPILAKQKK